MKNKKILLMSSLSMLLFSLTGCNSTNSNVKVENKIAGYNSFYPSSVSGALHNIGMGWISLEEQTELGKMNLGHDGTLPEVDNIGIQTSWDLIEKTPDVFDWSLIDETIEYWTKLGKSINLRICTDSLQLPEVYYGAPRWLYKAPYNVGYEAYEYNGTKNRAFVTDTTNETYRQRFEIFMNKLSEKYASNPSVLTIDIRGFGMFGEWHSGHSFDSMDDRYQGLCYIIDKYCDAFAKNGKTLFLSCSWDYQGLNKDGSSASTEGMCDYDEYLYDSALDYGMSLDNVGYRRDGLAGNGVTKYLTDEKALYDVIRSGKRVVNCGEFYSDYDSYVNNKFGMSPLEAVDELLFKSRCNYSTVMGWINTEVARIVENGDEEIFNRGNNKMGFRFKVDEAKFPSGAKAGSTIKTYVKLSNSGVGRFSLPNYKFSLFLIDENGKIKQKFYDEVFDLRTLLNGETINLYGEYQLDENLVQGEYIIAAAIVDSDNEPAIRLAQVGNYDDYLYPIGKMNIGNYSSTSGELFQTIGNNDLKNYVLSKSSYYELTFDYLPKVNLKNDYKMGDDNGFEVRLVNSKGEKIVVSNFQDVSEEKTTKTVTFATPRSDSYHLEIDGSGVYQNKIEVSNIKIVKKTGYLEQFDNNYNLDSTSSKWYTPLVNADIVKDDNNEMNNTSMFEAYSDKPHAFTDALLSDPNNLKIKPNTAYQISFDYKSAVVSSNGGYHALTLQTNNEDILSIGEWYDRPDTHYSNKTFTFITPSNVSNLSLAFKIKNSGGYYLDNINLIELSSGSIIKGDDVKDVNNVRPVDPNKGLNKIEGFENGVLNDSLFTYGFNRWGKLVKSENEVIEGKYSITSQLDDVVFDFQDDNNYYEFMHSNYKYLKLESEKEYEISFDFKLMAPIKLISAPSLYGYGYITSRSKDNKFGSDSISFVNGDVSLENVNHYEGTIKTSKGENPYLIIGVYGRGTIIVDNIMVREK